MKIILTCFLFLIGLISITAQDIYYKPISNIIFANDEGTLDVGLNYEFKNTQIQAIYSLSEKYFIFGTYNISNTSYSYSTFLWGNTRLVSTNNLGYSFGGGIKKFGRIGRYDNLELLFGYEFQKVNKVESSPRFTDRDVLNHNYYKMYTQLNIIKTKAKFDFGYSLKLSYLKITYYEENGWYNNNFDFNDKSVVFIDPSVSFNFKMLTKKNLVLTSQLGLSAALNNLEFEGGYTYLAGPIAKFGVQYRFLTNKNKIK